MERPHLSVPSMCSRVRAWVTVVGPCNTTRVSSRDENRVGRGRSSWRVRVIHATSGNVRSNISNSGCNSKLVQTCVSVLSVFPLLYHDNEIMMHAQLVRNSFLQLHGQNSADHISMDALPSPRSTSSTNNVPSKIFLFFTS